MLSPSQGYQLELQTKELLEVSSIMVSFSSILLYLLHFLPSPSLFFLLFVFLLPLLPLFPLSFSPSLLLLLLFPSVPPSFFLSSSLYLLFLLLFFLPSPPPSLLQDQYRKLFESCQQQYQGEGPTGILLIYPQHCVHLIEAPWRVLRDVIRNLQEMDSNG